MKKKLNSLKVYLLTFLFAGFLFSACDKEESSSEVILNSWGPSPALRGGELKFIGVNLNEVSAIVLPQNVEITSFVTKTSELIVIQVPDETVGGQVLLKTSQGDIVPKTKLSISEPIAISSFSPAKVKPGDEVTINGTYLNLIKEVVFAEKKSVTQFVSQSREKLVVKVPMDAQTGLIVLSNGEKAPILIESETQLEIALPAVSTLSPAPVKPGTELKLTGSDLNLVKSILFPGGVKVETFSSQTATELSLLVPANSKEGTLVLEALSGVDVDVATALTLVSPAITEIAPNPAKTGGEITIKGTNLDLVTGVVFGGDVAGTIGARSAVELTVSVPKTAINGAVTLKTASDMNVSSSGELKLVLPTVTSFSPAETKTNAEIIITGTNLDVVTSVIFSGGTPVAVSGSETEIIVKVPTGTKSGLFTLVTTNNSKVVSNSELSFWPLMFPSSPNAFFSKTGRDFGHNGEKLDLFTDVIFPGGVFMPQLSAKKHRPGSKCWFRLIQNQELVPLLLLPLTMKPPNLRKLPLLRQILYRTGIWFSLISMETETKTVGGEVFLSKISLNFH
jgi:hypothetical protein